MCVLFGADEKPTVEQCRIVQYMSTTHKKTTLKRQREQTTPGTNTILKNNFSISVYKRNQYKGDPKVTQHLNSKENTLVSLFLNFLYHKVHRIGFFIK